MDYKEQRKMLRRHFNPAGWSLVLYYMLMNVAVSIVMIGQIVVEFFAKGMNADIDAVMERAMGNGWGYLLTCAVGFLILWLWKGKAFIKNQIFKKGRPMRGKDFACLVCVFLGVQLLFQLLAMAVEAIMNDFGGSIVEAMEAASVSAETLSMFLYLAVGAPICEELLFRGLLLRMLQPFGKRFAIYMTAFLFGIFHGNPVQTPFAFIVGLILGYVAVEYNITWAMLLHMINNLVLGDMLSRATQWMGVVGSSLVVWAVILGTAVAGAIIVACRRLEIKAYRRADRMETVCLDAFFSSPGIIVIFLLTCVNGLIFILPQFM